MKNINSLILVLLVTFSLSVSLFSREAPRANNSTNTTIQKASPRGGNCVPATKQVDMEINNVRARLLNGGDIWWDKSKGRYIVPKVTAGSGAKEVS